jgi:putative molybdopterin biosynthesis protein
VAAAVASGRADCGLAVAASAKALGLGFVPLYTERYQLVIPEEYVPKSNEDLLAPLFDLMEDAEFRRAVQALDGYSVEEMGKR